MKPLTITTLPGTIPVNPRQQYRNRDINNPTLIVQAHTKNVKTPMNSRQPLVLCVHHDQFEGLKKAPFHLEVEDYCGS
jgi:hypothetical protein